MVHSMVPESKNSGVDEPCKGRGGRAGVNTAKVLQKSCEADAEAKRCPLLKEGNHKDEDATEEEFTPNRDRAKHITESNCCGMLSCIREVARSGHNNANEIQGKNKGVELAVWVVPNAKLGPATDWLCEGRLDTLVEYGYNIGTQVLFVTVFSFFGIVDVLLVN